MDCTITYNGKAYTEQEFKRLVEASFSNYKATQSSQDAVEAYNTVMKQADALLGFLDQYGITLDDDKSFEPKELQEGDRKDITKALMKVDGLANNHFNYFTNYVSDAAAKEFNVNAVGMTNEKKLKDKMQAELITMLDAYEATLDNIAEKLNAIGKPDDKVVQLNIKKIQVAKDKLKIVKDNFDTIANVGLQKLYKDANLKVTTKTNEDGTTTTTVDEADNTSKIADMEEESSEDSVTDFKEVNSERDENYSQTSLEKNPKNSVRKELRILMRGIPLTDKDGNPMNTIMGIPAFVDFDTIFDTVIGLMADKSLTIDEAIAHLMENSDARPWLNEFANRLESSGDQVKNQFLHTMGNHALTMNFVQYSFDKDGKFTVKVMNTNAAELRRKTLSNWRNNLLGTDLLEADPETGQYSVNKNEALRLLEEYQSWTKGKALPNLKGISSLSNLQKEVIRTGKDLKITDNGTIKRLGLKPENFEEGEEKIYTVNNKIGDKYDTKELKVKKVNGKLEYVLGKPTTSPISRALTVKTVTSLDGKDIPIMEYNNMEPEEQAEAIEKVLEWLEAFGIDMHPNAIHRIFSGQYYVDKNTKLTPDKFFASTDSAHQPIGILAGWLQKAVNASNTIISPELEGNHPFRDNSIENGLAKFQAKYVENVATSSFRSGKKSIYGYTAYKYVTDRFVDLKTNNDDILTKLKSLAFSKNSAWLQWLENSGLPNAFNISHLDLNALKEAGKKIYKDNGITTLADADHEMVKLGLHTDMKQGSTTVKFTVDGVEFDMRIASMLFPTMSDKSTEVIVKAPVLKLNNIDYYTFNEETKTLEPNDAILGLVFNQLVLPEIERIIDFSKKNPNGTNIKGYDAGAKMLMFLPGLNDLKVSYKMGNGKTYNGNLQTLLNSENFELDDLSLELKSQIYPKIKEYLNELAKNKMKVWEENELVSKGEDGDTTLKFFDAAYVKDTDEKKELTNDLKANVIAFDFLINQMISNANAFMTIIGDPALYYKANPNDSNVKQAKDTFINVGKRLAAMIAPGSKLAGSKNETYQQIFLGDRISLSQNIGYLTELLDDKQFDAEEYNRIMAIEDKDKKQVEYDKFIEQYPNSAGYFEIESTDAQEYTTWQEHLHVLKQMGKTSDSVLSLTDKDLDEAEKIFTKNIPFEEMTDAQQEIFRKVMQPLKPVYTGQIYDEAQGVMRMMYIKSSSFPLIPQMTAGTELDKLRLALQEFQKGGFVRASYQTANKVGALTAPLKMFDAAGKIKPITQQQLQEASLTLNRKDFKIQQDVPFKSAKRSEDTTTMGSQLTKVLFGNGMMELSGFMMDGVSHSGKKLQQIYNETFTELYNLKKQKLYNELGIDEKTNEPINIKETAFKLQKLLKNEAVDRGWSKQDIDGLELEFIYNKNGAVVDYKFKLPLWMSANSNRIEALFNAIIDNRLVKMKLPGNAYVAGSEEGFKIQSNFEGIDKSQIVWLNNQFNGELQAANEKDGEFKPAQILVASKFRDNEGNLIDLLEKDGDNYKYIIETDKGFQLNEEMFDKELLDMITFRIPTSGHMSGSKVTVAGFLPHQVGDLIITPKNFTKQMGQDFDVDKLSSYQLWHTQDENGKLRPIKAGDNVKNIKEKLLQNKLINIHLAVFGNKDKKVQKKINAILSTDYAEDQAKRIEEVNAQDDTFFTPMSDEYQKQKMALGASGKIGTGAYSLDVTSHSLFEQAKSNGNQLQLLSNDLPFKMSFGSIDTEGKLGESKTKIVSKKDYFIARMNSLDGNDVILDNLTELLKKDEEVGIINFENQAQNYPELKRILDDYTKLQRTIAEVLSERQNIAVDNEKLQVMGKVNLNSYTMDVDKVLCMLGFDKGEDGNSISFLFLSQPIIKDYVAEMSKATSNIKGFNKDAEVDVIQKLYEKYFSPETLKLLKESEDSYEFDTAFGNQLTTDEMYNELTKNITEDKVNNHLQIIALNRFLMLKEYGLALRGVQGAINTDSKGLGKSIPEIGERIKTVTALVNNDKIQNAEKLIGDYLLTEDLSLESLRAKEKEGYIHVTENLMIRPTTSIGAVSLNALLTANTLWEKHFPYNKVSINTAIDEVMQLVSKSEASEAKKAEKQHIILKEVKKYLNAVMTQRNLIKSGTATEERYRLMYDDKKSNKVSLARYLSVVASKFPQLQQNKLLQRFNYDIDYTGKPSMILYENTAGANFDEDGLNNALLELLGTNLTLPEFNGEIYSAKKLAQDLINYAMLEGGVQEATQFAKFIPISYLEKMGFTGGLNSINYDTTNLFGFKENGPSDFAIQFARNNPTSLPKLLIDSELASKKLNSSISISDAGYNSQNAPNFIAFREKGKDYLWMKIGKEYKPVSVAVSKGNAGQKVFGYDIDPNQKQKQISKGKTREVAPPIPNEHVNDSAASNVINSERFGLGNDSFVNILNNVINTSGLPDNITVILKQLISKVNPNIKIQIVNGINSNGTYQKGVIQISKEYAETATNEDLARTILKETVHSVTDELILNHTDVDGNLEPKDGVPGAQAARNLIALFKRADAALSSGKYAEKYKSMREKFEKLKAGKDVGFDKEEKRILYGTANIKEFIEMMLTQPEFQQAMSEIKIGSSNTTLMDKFRAFIKSVLEAIGVEPGTLTDEAIKNIFQLIEESKPQVQNQSSTSVEREYTPENITSLKPNEVFVFGANTAGGHGGGTAGLAQRGTTSSNYTALPIGTKGKWSEYGIVDKLMQGTEGKSFGIVTKAATISGTSLKIGAKRSVPLSRIEESINALIKTASENPSLKFLVTKFGTNMAGFSEQEMKSLLENKNLPDNIILPKEFEVRATQSSTSVKEGVEISSNAKGLAAALTNPTELAKSKGNLSESYPITFKGKTYKDSEAAYQALKMTATKDDGPNSTYSLMVEIIKAKLEQHPILVSEITKQGGSAWILSSTHQPTKQNSVWETGGKNWFIKSLNDAYLATQSSTSVKPVVKDLSRWSDISGATTPYTDAGIVVTRVGNTEEQFGNPFIGSKRRDKQGNILASKVDNITIFNTIDEADQAYRDWLMGTKHQNIKPLRREWILKQINKGNLDGKTLLYYKPMTVENNNGTIVKGGYHSHADTLAEIVEELRGAQSSTSVKEGVSELFESNPELANIGTAEQYSNYLNTIFPDSKVKDIVYHMTSKSGKLGIEEKSRFLKPGEEGYQKRDYATTGGIYFTDNNSYDEDTEMYGSPISGAYGTAYVSVILNIKNPLIDLNKSFGDISKTDLKNNDGFIGTNESKEIGVKEPEQIHILGGKQDIQGFKEFVGQQSTTTQEVKVESTINQEVYNKVKTNLSQLVNRENAEFNVNPDSITFPDDINLSEFNGYPKTLTFVSEENITDAQLKFISTHKEYIEAMLNETNATDMNELLEAIEEKEVEPDPTASEIEVGMSDSTIADIENKVAETETMISESSSGEKIELFPRIFANAGQTKAIEKLNNFVKDRGKQVFVLKGRGGTGKTTIIKKILDGIKGEIAAATISHNAKGVLQNSMGPSVQVGTIAAALGLIPKRNNPGEFEKNPKFNKNKSPFYNADVIIIDECSMLTQEMVNDIINFSKNPNVKIIFMGDNVQLPPIETDVKLQNKDSVSFTANTKPEYTATLTERMRQGEDSPIVVLSDVIAVNVENKEPELRVIKNRKNKFDEKKNTGILFETKDSMMGQLTKDLENDKENTKIIAYTNAEKDSMNNLAREIVWGKGNTNEFNKGEILINEDTKEESSIASQNVFNGEQYVVLDSTPININVKKLNSDFSINTIVLPGYSLKVQNENGETITMQILSPKIKSKYAEVQKNNASLAFKMGGASWNIYWNNEEEHVKVDYGYAITSHKSQGSTYNNVYVMEDNILGVQDASIKTKNKSLYVAVTRPRYKAVIVSNKNASNVTIDEEYKNIGLNINTRGKSFEPKEISEEDINNLPKLDCE